MSGELSDRALCDHEDVERLVPGFEFDSKTEELLIELINRQSEDIHAQAGREFKPIATGSSARLFDLTRWHACERRVRIGDNVTITNVEVQQLDGTVLETIDAANRVALPRIRQAWEPVTQLWLPGAGVAAPASTLAPGRVLAVTGTWGFPDIPTKLRVACAALVLVRYTNGVAETGTALAEAAAELNLAGMFAAARETIRSLSKPGFA